MPSKHANPKVNGAQTTSPKSRQAYERRDVNTSLLLEPLNPSRETFDEQKINELIVSVRTLGILMPLIVEREGEKFRVHAGHRRLIVAQALDLQVVPCHIYEHGAVPGEAVKAHENAFREDLNPGEEARYFGRLLETVCGGDVDRLVDLVKLRRDYVENRLLLLRGDPKVLDALIGKAITVGVASELNKVKDAARRFAFLDAAMQGGATVRMVRDWRVQAEAGDLYGAGELAPAPLAGVAVQEVPVFVMQCLLCDGTENTYDMHVVYLHGTCKKLFLDRFLATIKGQHAEPAGDV